MEEDGSALKIRFEGDEGREFPCPKKEEADLFPACGGMRRKNLRTLPLLKKGSLRRDKKPKLPQMKQYLIEYPEYSELVESISGIISGTEMESGTGF